MLLICIPLLRCFVKYRMSLFTLAWMFLALSHLVIHKMSVRFIFVSVVLPLPAVYPPLPSPLFSSSLNESRGTWKGQSAVPDIHRKRLKIRSRIFPLIFKWEITIVCKAFLQLPLLFLCSLAALCVLCLSQYIFFW